MHLISPFDLRNAFANITSLAVVGNAPTILDHENGRLIDSHDVVVRFNRATVEGTETKIGSRTDILVVNASNSAKLGPSPHTTVRPKCLITYVSPRGIPNVDSEAFKDWVGDTPTMMAFGPDLLEIPSAPRTRPLTSGTYFLFMALRLWKIERLFVTGFTMFGAVPGGSEKYYQDPRAGVGTFHDLDAEAVIFARILSEFPGQLSTTNEVEELIRRHGPSSGNGESARSGATLPLAKRLAGGLSWRLMATAMRLRRFSETQR